MIFRHRNPVSSTRQILSFGDADVIDHRGCAADCREIVGYRQWCARAGSAARV
jgi:hypothetical protein